MSFNVAHTLVILSYLGFPMRMALEQLDRVTLLLTLVLYFLLFFPFDNNGHFPFDYALLPFDKKRGRVDSGSTRICAGGTIDLDRAAWG